MSNIDIRSAKRPDWDRELVDIADYVCDMEIDSELAYETAHYCVMDTLACGFQALDYPACTKLLGPVVPGATLSGGARVPGTSYELEPVMAAFNIGVMIRWLARRRVWVTTGLAALEAQAVDGAQLAAAAGAAAGAGKVTGAGATYPANVATSE